MYNIGLMSHKIKKKKKEKKKKRERGGLMIFSANEDLDSPRLVKEKKSKKT